MTRARLRLSAIHALTYSPREISDLRVFSPSKMIKLPVSAQRLLSCMEESSDYVVLATRYKVLIGWFRFSVRRGKLFGQGTWVAGKHRREGLATAMWERALKLFKPKYVEASVVSRSGKALMRTLRDQHPKLSFKIFGE